jgi:hypothetical protein
MGMRRSGVVGVVLAVVLLGLGLSAASASATGLLSLRANGTPLAAGAPFTLSSGNLSLTFGTPKRPASVSCTKSVLDGAVETNGKAKDAVPISAASFSGGDPLNEEMCASSGEFTTAGSAAKLYLLPSGKAELRAPLFELDPPPPHNSSFGICRFEYPAIHGTFNTSTSEPGTPITVTFASHLKIVPDSGGECGTGATLHASFEVTSAEAPVIGLIVP